MTYKVGDILDTPTGIVVVQGVHEDWLDIVFLEDGLFSTVRGSINFGWNWELEVLTNVFDASKPTGLDIRPAYDSYTGGGYMIAADIVYHHTCGVDQDFCTACHEEMLAARSQPPEPPAKPPHEYKCICNFVEVILKTGCQCGGK